MNYKVRILGPSGEVLTVWTGVVGTGQGNTTFNIDELARTLGKPVSRLSIEWNTEESPQ